MWFKLLLHKHLWNLRLWKCNSTPHILLFTNWIILHWLCLEKGYMLILLQLKLLLKKTFPAWQRNSKFKASFIFCISCFIPRQIFDFSQRSQGCCHWCLVCQWTLRNVYWMCSLAKPLLSWLFILVFITLTGQGLTAL